MRGAPLEARPAEPWLPREALLSDKASALVAGCIANWSRHWFAAQAARSSRSLQDDWPSDPKAADWRSLGGFASVSLGPTAQALIAGALLGTRIPQGPLQDKDRHVVEHLARACLDDLLQRIAKLAGSPAADVKEGFDTRGGEAWTWWDVGFKNSPRALKLAISRPALVALVKSSLPPAGKPTAASLRAALLKSEVTVSARLGECSLGLADLKGLGIGDVVVLDSPAASPVDILVNGSPSQLKAAIEESDDKGAQVILANPKEQNRA